MTTGFEAGDIFEIAMRIEENGSNFYRFAVQIAATEDAKQLFRCLAEEEDKHKEIFRTMLAGIERQEPREGYPGEYGAYLRSYVDNNIIFTKEVMDRELEGVQDTPSALNFAIKRELDSILYYHEIKNFVPPKHHQAIDDIIDEERRHFEVLSELKKKYT
ncbi:MAG: ferritin family protein [Syntrophales bacterium]|jgi:rubrerythrin|nr:ferritin family protein [Syntrophales bacterium]MCK9527093.1 ferritin family protein [Syntrophales bacterium]MDX9921782.1 ferritin family protein [Syntrophales bacterium]